MTCLLVLYNPVLIETRSIVDICILIKFSSNLQSPVSTLRMSGPLPATYLAGWHEEHLVEKMRYSRLGQTELIVSQLGFGGSVVGGVYQDKGDLQEIFQVEVSLTSTD